MADDEGFFGMDRAGRRIWRIWRLCRWGVVRRESQENWGFVVCRGRFSKLRKGGGSGVEGVCEGGLRSGEMGFFRYGFYGI